ncbi:MAG: hypothetical protein RLZZ407_1165 [Pseudomonadota bacterium]|jgi:hypothetical protein
MGKFTALLTAILCSLMLPLEVNAQETERYVATTAGCKIAYSTAQFKKMEWSGSCVDGLVEGFGTQTTIDTDGTKFTWTGKMVRGKSEGDGIQFGFQKDGSLFATIKGIWADNFLISGTLTVPNGIIYDGAFKNELFHGQGVLFNPDGSSYVGSFQDGVFSGQGVYTYSKGGSFEGNFLFGKAHGAGIQRATDGSVIQSGYWSNGIYSRPFSTLNPSNSGVSSPATTAPNSSSLGACAENGSCYGDVSTTTGRAKTVPVQGYYRKDGTYVRGHYRSKPQ